MRLLILVATVCCTLPMQIARSYAADIRKVQIVAGDDSSFVRNTASALVEVLKQTDPALNVEMAATSRDLSIAENDKRILVLIGDRAVADTGLQPGNAPFVLALLPQRSALEIAEKKYPGLSIIYFEQPLTRLLNLAEMINANPRHPKPSVIGIIATDGLQRYLAGADAAAAERKQQLHVEKVDSELGVGRAMAKVAENSNVVLAIADPMVQTANTVQPILLLTYRAGIPVVGYSASYLKAGAAVVLYSTPEQLAQQAAENIAAGRAGKPLAALQPPRYFKVEVNPTVARSLGINLPNAEVLDKWLRLLKE